MRDRGATATGDNDPDQTAEIIPSDYRSATQTGTPVELSIQRGRRILLHRVQTMKRKAEVEQVSSRKTRTSSRRDCLRAHFCPARQAPTSTHFRRLQQTKPPMKIANQSDRMLQRPPKPGTPRGDPG